MRMPGLITQSICVIYTLPDLTSLPLHLSYPPCDATRMRLSQIPAYFRLREGELLAGFGQARLIRHLDGRYELRGGTNSDRQAAREWCSLFMHQAVFACSSPRTAASPRPSRL